MNENCKCAWKTGIYGHLHCEGKTIKSGMLIESIRTEGLRFSWANGDSYFTNLMNKYEANLLY